MPRNDGFTNRARDWQAQRVSSKSPLFKNAIKETQGVERTFRAYEGDIERYAKDYFGITLWKKQQEICQALLEHRFVCVRSANITGKSYLLGVLINFFYDTLNPLIGIGTAVTKPQVTDVMFGYARKFRNANPALSNDWKGSVEPTLKSDEDHYFKGVVTATGDSIQGRHGENVVIIIDEAVGIKDEMFEALESLMNADNVYVLCIYNPTNPSSYVANLELQPDWYTVTMSAYDHPNIWAGLDNIEKGLEDTYKLPFPGAINLKRFEQLLKQWSHRISAAEYNRSKDIMLPTSLLTNDIEYYRPGPRAESRLLGRWPTISFDNVFSEYEINQAETLIIPDKPNDKLSIGVDVARYGSDFSAFCVRYGNKILLLEEINGLGTLELVAKVVSLAQQYSKIYEIPVGDIDIAVDSTGGHGNGPIDLLLDADYSVTPINASERAWNIEEYKNHRSELWFEIQKMFYESKISTARLPQLTKNNLKKQLLAPRFTYSEKGQRVVDSKKIIKKRVGRSPDIADALMLAFAVNSEFSSGISVETDE